MDRAASQLPLTTKQSCHVFWLPISPIRFFCYHVPTFENLHLNMAYERYCLQASPRSRWCLKPLVSKLWMSGDQQGMIAIPCSGQLSNPSLDLTSNCPTVLIDRVSVHFSAFDTVTNDNREPLGLACQHLADAGPWEHPYCGVELVPPS